MSVRDGYEPGVPCWVATIQPDPEGAAAFYSELFGWDYEDGGGFFVARLRGRDVAAVAPLPPEVDPPPPPDWITDIWVDSADDAAATARSAGGSVVAEPFDGPAGRVTVIADQAEAMFAASERHLHKGAQLVNEPGAWSISRLETPDPEGAKAFYAALFRWTAETFDVGDTSITMCPSLRATRKPTGASTSGSTTSMPRRRRPRSCRGRRSWGPSDIPIGTTAVLADPAGAVFSVTHINPAS